MSMTPSGFYANRGLYDPFTGPALILWDPFRDFSSLLPPPDLGGGAAAFDWRETPEAHVFKADLPGVRKEEVRVEVEDGGVLSVSGERRKEEVGKTDTWHCVERSSGRFERRFRLPENVEVDRIKAAMENGVLTVTVPKTPEKKREKVRSVQISGYV